MTRVSDNGVDIPRPAGGGRAFGAPPRAAAEAAAGNSAEMFGDLVKFHELRTQKLWDFDLKYEHHEQPPLFFGGGDSDVPAGEIKVSPDWDGYLSSNN